MNPDWSHVDSVTAAAAEAERGTLAKLLLVPESFGGTPVPANILFVPPFVVEEKARIDRDMIAPLVKAGTINHYVATPTYQGASFVPTSIVIVGTDPGDFTATIKIWGDALTSPT